MSSSVDQIKSRIDIASLIGSYIKLEQSGANLKARCPFHNEKTPSFFVSPARGSYYCFGCAASGDIFTFVEEFEGLDFKGALKLLADKTGVTLETYSRENKETKSEKEKLYEVMEEATKFFENNLADNTQAQEYLKTRGLTDKSIKDFRVGFAVLDWRKLYDYLKSESLPAGRQGFADMEIEKAGLAKRPGDKTKAMYDRFRGRIMFPISDSSGRIIAFSGRLFESVPTPEGVGRPTSQESVGPKYLNSPETPIFSKNAVLYGLDKAKESIRKNNFSILVEGQMDLVLSHQAGYKNTVATSGTALSDSEFSKENIISNLGLVRRLASNIVLAFDGDSAGFKATNRAGHIALSLGMDVKVAAMPDGIDPADLISKYGIDSWRDIIKNSKHIIEFLLDKILKNHSDDLRRVGKEIKEKVLPFVDALESSIEKMHFLKKISDMSSIPLPALQDDLKKIERESRMEKAEIEKAEEKTIKLYRKDYILRKLLGIVLWQRSLTPTPKGVGGPTESVGQEYQVDVDNILQETATILGIKEEEILQSVKDSREDLIFEAEVFYGGSEDLRDLKKDTVELLSNLEEEHLKEKLGIKMRKLHHAEELKDIEKSKSILKQISEINNKIQEIKNKK